MKFTNVSRMRAGYQDKPDAMREEADKLFGGPPGSVIEGIQAKNGAEREHMRFYKKGGKVKSTEKEMHKKSDCGKARSGTVARLLGANNHPKVDMEVVRKDKNVDGKDMVGERSRKVTGSMKFAAGGAAKVRKGEATASGKMVPITKKSYKACMK